jgi:hypothetical protein
LELVMNWCTWKKVRVLGSVQCASQAKKSKVGAVLRAIDIVVIVCDGTLKLCPFHDALLRNVGMLSPNRTWNYSKLKKDG